MLKLFPVRRYVTDFFVICQLKKVQHPLSFTRLLWEQAQEENQ